MPQQLMARQWTRLMHVLSGILCASFNLLSSAQHATPWRLDIMGLATGASSNSTRCVSWTLVAHFRVCFVCASIPFGLARVPVIACKTALHPWTVLRQVDVLTSQVPTVVVWVSQTTHASHAQCTTNASCPGALRQFFVCITIGCMQHSQEKQCVQRT